MLIKKYINLPCRTYRGECGQKIKAFVNEAKKVDYYVKVRNNIIY